MSNAVRLGWRNGKIIAGTRVLSILKDLGVKASVASRLCDMSIRSIIIPWKVAEYSDAMPGRKIPNTIFIELRVSEDSLYLFLFSKLCSAEHTVMRSSVK